MSTEGESFSHVPVLLDETIEALNIKPDGIYADGTVGGAGHSSQIAKRLGDKGRLICLDQDEDAVKTATERLKPFGEKVSVVKSNYAKMKEVLLGLKITSLDGILIDIGVSSYQLDNAQRGFSYMNDAPLDMRMDRDNPLSAREVVNEYPQDELFRIIKEYGEDRFAKSIASKICQTRKEKPIDSTLQLAEIVKSAIPAKFRTGGPNPAMRTFQAIRIEVNDELGVLKESLDDMISLLNPGGRLAVITFHSLEDRIVKNAFKTAEDPCICPPQFPVCVCGRKSKGKIITKKPVTPGQEEIERNIRAHSAKLRVFERGNIQ